MIEQVQAEKILKLINADLPDEQFNWPVIIVCNPVHYEDAETLGMISNKTYLVLCSPFTPSEMFTIFKCVDTNGEVYSGLYSIAMIQKTERKRHSS